LDGGLLDGGAGTGFASATVATTGGTSATTVGFTGALALVRLNVPQVTRTAMISTPQPPVHISLVGDFLSNLSRAAS
jgi:hypothetical protein